MEIYHSCYFLVVAGAGHRDHRAIIVLRKTSRRQLRFLKQLDHEHCWHKKDTKKRVEELREEDGVRLVRIRNGRDEGGGWSEAGGDQEELREEDGVRLVRIRKS